MSDPATSRRLAPIISTVPLGILMLANLANLARSSLGAAIVLSVVMLAATLVEVDRSSSLRSSQPC